MQKPVDFHMHTAASEDSEASPDSMCLAAIEQGLYAIAITDHVEMIGYQENGYDQAMALSWQYSCEMQHKFNGRLRIAKGIELGQPLYSLAEAEAILDNHAYDFILYSQHKLSDDIDYYFYDYSNVNIKESMDAYFDAVYQGVLWGRFHSLAHLTYPFRYMPDHLRPKNYKPWQDRIDAIFKLLADTDKALEINTSGMRNPSLNCCHPDATLVKRFKELGGEKITVGSDAHAPGDVGAHIADAVEIAKTAGFQYITAYFGGTAEMIKIG